MSRTIRRGLVAVLAGLPMAFPWVCHAQESARQVPEVGSWWFEIGMGEAVLHSASGGGSGSTFNLGTGWTIAPQWALGMEIGIGSNRNGCEILECDDFGPDVSHTTLVAEYFPRQSPWRLRMAAGTFDYCTATWLFACDEATGPGAGLYATRHWLLSKRAVWSVGVRVGAEVAWFPAKRSVEAPSFWHSAALLSVQFRRN
jgi:hypothetical protein